MRVRIIANPVAGGGKGLVRAQGLCAALEARGAAVDLRVTQGAGEGQVIAGEGDTDCIAVVGGDGTLHEVVNGLKLGEDTPVAIFACGSANVVARELRMPKDAAEMAALILEQRVHRMDLILWGEERVLLGAGAGLDAAVAAVVKAGRGTKSSVWRWVWPAVRTVLSYDYPKVRVCLDDLEISEGSPYVIVGNCRYSAGVFPSTPLAKTNDGLLDVCLVRKLNPFRVLFLAVGVWLPGFTKRPDIIYRKGKRVTLTPVSSAVPLQVDGDPAGTVPTTFSVLPQALPMIASCGRCSKCFDG